MAQERSRKLQEKRQQLHMQESVVASSFSSSPSTFYSTLGRISCFSSLFIIYFHCLVCLVLLLPLLLLPHFLLDYFLSVNVRCSSFEKSIVPLLVFLSPSTPLLLSSLCLRVFLYLLFFVYNFLLAPVVCKQDKCL